MNFDEFVISIRQKGNYSETFALMDEYLSSREIDSWEKLWEILADREQFLISFLDFVPYKAKDYDGVAVYVYEYLLNRSGCVDDLSKSDYTFNLSKCPQLYDYDSYDIALDSDLMKSLVLTDSLNTVSILLLSLPTSEIGESFSRFKDMTIAEFKEMIKRLIFEGRNLQWSLRLSFEDVKILIEALNYYNQRVLENALEVIEAKESVSNLLDFRISEKKEIVLRQLQSLVSSIINNPKRPRYVFGTLTKGDKRSLWGLVRGSSTTLDELCLERLVTNLARAFTYTELQRGVYMPQEFRVAIGKTRAISPIDLVFTNK